jgi:hypothetical protein
MRTMLVVAMLGLLPIAAHAEAFTIDRDESVFAIATQRAGIAGRMAHDHLVHAGEYEYSLAMPDGEPAAITFSLTVLAEGLVADDPGALDRWWPRLQEHNLVARGPSSFRESERADVREAMLGEDQLDVANHPEITAELLEIYEDADAEHTHTGRVAITVVGETVETDFTATIELAGDEMAVEAYAVARFTDFGIRPYRAFLGAVRNQDEFVIFVRFMARRE